MWKTNKTHSHDPDQGVISVTNVVIPVATRDLPSLSHYYCMSLLCYTVIVRFIVAISTIAASIRMYPPILYNSVFLHITCID